MSSCGPETDRIVANGINSGPAAGAWPEYRLSGASEDRQQDHRPQREGLHRQRSHRLDQLLVERLQRIHRTRLHPGEREDFTIRRQVQWASDTATDQEVTAIEVEAIRQHRSYDPRVGYARWPPAQEAPRVKIGRLGGWSHPSSRPHQEALDDPLDRSPTLRWQKSKPQPPGSDAMTCRTSGRN